MRGSVFSLVFGALVVACGVDQVARPQPLGTSERSDVSGGEANGATGGGTGDTGGAGFAAAGGTGDSGGTAGQGGALLDGAVQSFVIRGVRLPDGRQVDLLIDGDTVQVSEEGAVAGFPSLDAEGLSAYPAFVDSHVHLTYFPVGESLAALGVLAAVDLAAPIESLENPPDYMDLLSAGPMVTSVMGYPTQSWGSNGYGLESADSSSAVSAVGQLVAAGARVIKVPLDGDNAITNEQLAAITEAAHDAGLKVAAHALSADAAERAAEYGCDVLAHTPTETLPERVVALWADKSLVSTLKAFGAGEAARDNLARLHDAGTTVLYGTDLGNLRSVGVDVGELQLLEAAGLSREQTLASLTTAAAQHWGTSVGTLTLPGEASFVLLNGDPSVDLNVLLEPAHVFYRGRALKLPVP